MTSKEGFFINISSDILLEILSRLPAIDVISCKLVCKRWRKMSSTREFAKLHLSRSNPCLVYFHHEYKEFCRAFNFDNGGVPNNLYYDPEIASVPNPSVSAALIGSVNGLVCFCHHYGYRQKDNLYVCNPVTWEYVTLPIVEGFVQYRNIVAYGFGVSATGGQYKVVRISHGLLPNETGDLIGFRNSNSECRVCTLGTGSWRSIDGVPIMYDHHDNAYSSGSHDNAYSNGLFLNGNLRWLIEHFERSELISCFDVEKELFRPFPSPPVPLPAANQPRETFFGLSIVIGCLCLCVNTFESDIDIWVMKQYGVKNSWMKDYVISKVPYYDRVRRYEKITLLQILKDGDRLLFTNKKFLLTYYSKIKSMQMIHTLCEY